MPISTSIWFCFSILILISCGPSERKISSTEQSKKQQIALYEIHSADAYATQVNIKAPLKAKYVLPEGGNNRWVYWRKDMNADAKADLLVDLGAYGAGDENFYGVFLKVKAHQFRLAFFGHLQNPQFVKDQRGKFILQSSKEFGNHSTRTRYTNYQFDQATSFFELDTSYVYEERFTRDTIIIMDSLYFQLTDKDHDPENMLGKSVVKISNVRNGKIIQVIKSDDFWFNQNMSIGYEDVNFDGYKDLLMPTGHGGSYGSPTNNYYLFDPTLKRFVYHAGLTEQEQGSCWPLEFNAQKKQVISNQKSGCCWHRTSTFEFKDGKLKLVKRYTEELDPRDRVVKNTEVFH